MAEKAKAAQGRSGNQGKCVDVKALSQNLSDYASEIVTFFKGATGTKPVKDVPWRDALERIRRGDYKTEIERLRNLPDAEYKKQKKHLPSITFAGSFSKRKNDCLTEPTGFIIPDIDHIKDVDRTFSLLCRDPLFWFAFRSPGGDGIKVGIRAEGIASDADHKMLFAAVEGYFREVYAIDIDQACKDISRLTFVSHDPDLFVNPDPKLFDMEAWQPQKRQAEPERPPAAEGSGKEKYARKVLERCCNEIQQAAPGDMHATRLRMSRLAGGYAHYLTDQEVINALTAAVEGSATADPKSAMQTIKDGFSHGRQNPITIPDLKKTEGPRPGGKAVKVSKNFQFLATQDQQGAAEIYAQLYQGIFCYDHASGTWSAWKGHSWDDEDYGEPVRAVDSVIEVHQEVIREINARTTEISVALRDADPDTESKLKIEKRNLDARYKSVQKTKQNLMRLFYRKQVIEFAAQGQGSLGISGKEWDSMPWLLPCQNGVIDLTTGKISAGRPDQYLKAASPTEYDPQASCPRFIQFLFEIFDNDYEMVDFIQRVIGSALVGENIEHKLFVLHGRGRNGKDTLLETINYVLGDSLAGGIQSELLLAQDRTRSSAGPSADVMRLRGLRIAWASETSEGRRLDSGKVKLITGGGSLPARAPYGKKEITFPQSHSLFLMTNSKPKANPDDYALWKRMVLIPFDMSFVDAPAAENERKRDPNLLAALKREARGVLAWMIQGCMEWQRKGLQPPNRVNQSTDEYRREEDVLSDFIDECCIAGEGKAAYASALYQEYSAWCQRGGMRPMSAVNFGKKMHARFEKVKSNRGYYYEGIGIIQDV